MMFNLSGRKALITGATGGIGEAKKADKAKMQTVDFSIMISGVDVIQPDPVRFHALRRHDTLIA